MNLSAGVKQKKGFTLIELLVVIAILGILVAVVTVSFSGSQKQARDVRRKSDLKMYQNALEIYANKNNGLYPEYSSLGINWTSFCDWVGVPSPCPNDPKYDSTGSDPDSFPSYGYQSDGTFNSGTPKATKYALWSKLENTTGYWVVCSSGTNFSSVTSPGIGSCP